MRIASWPLLAFSSTTALLACLFVVVYNHVGLLLAKGDTLKALVEDVLSLQIIAFVLPLAGYVAAFTMRKSNNPLLGVLVSQFLLLFAFAWVLVAILVWQVERIKITNLIN